MTVARGRKYLITSLIHRCFFSIVPESLRWHLLYNNFTQAEAIVEQTATFNKLPFPRKLFDEIKVNSVKQTTLPTKRRKAGIFDVFASPELRKITFTLSTIW